MKWVWMLFLFAINSATGQFYFYDKKYFDQPVLIDIGGNLGMMSCLTDLGYGSKFNKGVQLTKSAFYLESGVFIAVRWNQLVGFRLQFNSGKISAADSVLNSSHGNEIYRYQRNLHFRSRITEAILIAIVYPAGFFQSGRPPKLSPYLFAGGGLFHFNPQALLFGQWTSLAPLRSEGFDPSAYYNRWQTNLVTGIGCSYEIDARFSTLIECCYRFLHTDYLDDVSTLFVVPNTGERSTEQAEQIRALYALSRVRQGPDVSRPGAIRGNPSNKDSYYSFRLCLSWTINRQRIH
jgi:hypothetical protein